MNSVFELRYSTCPINHSLERGEPLNRRNLLEGRLQGVRVAVEPALALARHAGGAEGGEEGGEGRRGEGEEGRRRGVSYSHGYGEKLREWGERSRDFVRACCNLLHVIKLWQIESERGVKPNFRSLLLRTKAIHTQSRSYSMPSRNLSVFPPFSLLSPPDPPAKDAINFWSAEFHSGLQVSI